jgi:hypothetical protein
MHWTAGFRRVVISDIVGPPPVMSIVRLSSRMTREYTKPLVVPCPHCGGSNVFNQPYAYHAGFGDQGFLYNGPGTCTLIWSAYDPEFEALVGRHNPWALSREKQRTVEEALQPAPDGSRWLFSNPARCRTCGHAISGPMGETIYYLEYEVSIDVDPLGHPGAGLKDVLRRGGEPGAPPNGGPATLPGDSGAAEGPPSVS